MELYKMKMEVVGKINAKTQPTSRTLELGSTERPVTPPTGDSSFLLKWSRKNSTAIKVKAEAGMYHITLGMLPLNMPRIPSSAQIFIKASSHPLYLWKSMRPRDNVEFHKHV
jgi:hypothetical protein